MLPKPFCLVFQKPASIPRILINTGLFRNMHNIDTISAKILKVLRTGFDDNASRLAENKRAWTVYMIAI